MVVFLSLPARADRYEVAGVIRNTGAGWYTLTGSNHTPLNICGVSNNASNITVTFCDVMDEVHTFLCAPDETYAAYSCGASVSTSAAKITVKNAAGATVNPNNLTSPLGNLWLYGVFDNGHQSAPPVPDPENIGFVLDREHTQTATQGNYSFRQVLARSLLTAPSGTVTKVRVKFKAGASGLQVNDAYIGQKVNIHSFDGNQEALTFGGSSSVSIPANGEVSSDWVSFSWDKTSDLVVSWYRGAGNNSIYYTSGVSGAIIYYNVGNSAAATAPTGYTVSGNNISVLKSIEVDGF